MRRWHLTDRTSRHDDELYCIKLEGMAEGKREREGSRTSEHKTYNK